MGKLRSVDSAASRVSFALTRAKCNFVGVFTYPNMPKKESGPFEPLAFFVLLPPGKNSMRNRSAPQLAFA